MDHLLELSHYVQKIQNQYDGTQPLRFKLTHNNVIEFSKIILSYLKTQFDATQSLLSELNRYA